MDKPDSFTKYGIPVFNSLTAAEVDPWNAEEAVKAQMPMLDSITKTDYLGYRACGFSIREAASLVGVGQRLVMRWRKSDPVFRRWEEEGLQDLQGRVSEIIIRNQFLRNFHLVMRADGIALKKQNFDQANMSKEERDWASEAAKRYKAQDFALMLKALAPDQGGSDGPSVSLHVHLDSGAEAKEDQYRAALRTTLDQFTVTRQFIEAESQVIDDASTTG